jgi:lipopolysaccharide/colanic/teichoic acid biosynthesis glycosyltransferase
MLKLKRSIDIAVSLAAMPALAVLTLAMTAALRIMGSDGPVFFRQERIGLGGRRFKCYKFRTMALDADSSQHQAHLSRLMGLGVPMVKMDSIGDSRLIPGGWLLRASGLDELPQLFNVLRGEMSLIGPRPCLPYEFERYLPWQRERFEAAPGLTGLWQVSGKNRTTFDEMIRLDIEYARNRSLWLDMKIVLMTAPAIVRQCLDTRAARRAARSRARTVVALSYQLTPEAPKEMVSHRAS